MTRHRQQRSVTALKQILHQARKAGQGFTLIEVLIVVGILLVLAAIGIPSYTGFMESARSARTNYSNRATANAGAASSALNAATAN